ncbi:hypothetical protein PspLS_00368 [Pyricularia sp. CBS 133598]|nr:hypothetical protein PspLS_00368 [Pyricularia sp. CBS 133598]
MEYTLPTNNRYFHSNIGQRSNSPTMSTLAMAAPSPHAPFKKEYFSNWDDRRQADYAPSRPRSDPERIALPSIRQAFPDLLRLRVIPQDGQTSTPSSTTSPTAGPPGTLTPPEYVHSPTSQNKRRRLSFGDDQEERVSQVPRLYTSQSQAYQRRDNRPLSPVTLSGGPRSSTSDSWAGSSRTSPFLPGTSTSTLRSPAAIEQNDPMDRQRPTLPSLPHLNFDRSPMEAQSHMHHHHQPHPHQQQHGHHVRAMSGDEYMMEQHRGMVQQHPHSAVEPGYRQPAPSGYPYPYHHPSRSQSLSMGAMPPMDRMPFSPSGYSAYHGDYMRMNDMGGMGFNGDNKQRKRRGNLPKETTDKLRAWFLAHLSHPYPTEDEKQELMRQTGLQMNQISNWFINARRRQLPAMINNARAESDALAQGRGLSDGSKILLSTERSDYDSDKRGSPISDDGASHLYHDDMHRRAVGMKRGSV